jgi:predicted DNA-binding antitoxin AbrB/MazE fold protein
MLTVIRAIYEHGNLRLLDPVDLAEGEQVSLSIARDALSSNPSDRRLSAREMLKLPEVERRRLLAASAALAEEEYRTNKDLTDFEAFGDNDLFDETP